MNFLTEENANKAEITSENMTEIITRLKACSSSLKNNVLDPSLQDILNKEENIKTRDNLLKYSNSLEKLSLVLDNLKQTIDALLFIFKILVNNNGGLLYDLIKTCGEDSLLSKSISELINKINEAQNNVIFEIDNLIKIIDKT